MLVRPVWTCLLGFATAMLLVMPGFRPNDFPVAYVIVFLVGGAHLLMGLRLPNQGKLALLIWLLPIGLVLIHTTLFDITRLLPLSARNGMTLLAALLLLSIIRLPEQQAWLFIGMAPILLFDGLVGIGQFFDVGFTNRISNLLAVRESDVLALEKQLSTPRIWGIHSRAHGFAYDQAVWALLVFWSLLGLKLRPSARRLMIVLVAVACLAAFLSAQRSIVWFLFPALFVIYGVARSVNRAFFLAGITALVLISFDVYRWLVAENPVLTRLTMLESSADQNRVESWNYAVKVISENPLLGSSEITVAIHNAVLNGGAHYGVMWIVFFLTAIAVTSLIILRTPTAALHRIAALLLLAMMLANAMFHTHTPGKNDMTFIIGLGLALTILNIRRLVSRSSYRPVPD